MVCRMIIWIFLGILFRVCECRVLMAGSAGAPATFDKWPLNRCDCEPLRHQSGFRLRCIGRLGDWEIGMDLLVDFQFVIWFRKDWKVRYVRQIKGGLNWECYQLNHWHLTLWSGKSAASGNHPIHVDSFVWSILIMWNIVKPDKSW